MIGPIVTAYSYDKLYRLTDTTANIGNTYPYTYTYDANGNRVSEQVPGEDAVASVYDTANRLTSVGGVSYTWDDNGNLM